jgi:hypothetical protein
VESRRRAGGDMHEANKVVRPRMILCFRIVAFLSIYVSRFRYGRIKYTLVS